MFTPQHFTTIHGTILCSHHSILLQCTELFCVHATAFYKLQCTELSYVHTTTFYYNARNYIVFTPQRFTTMYRTILCSHHSLPLGDGVGSASEYRTRDSKVAGSIPGWKCGRLFVCCSQGPFSVLIISVSVGLHLYYRSQQVKDPGYPAKGAGGRWQMNTHSS